MYNGLLHAHSGLRWIVLLLLVITVVMAFMKWMSKDDGFSAGFKKLVTFNTIFFHIQFLIGVVLLFISPKVIFDADFMSNKIARFYGLEHALIMLIAVVLVTIGGAKMKRLSEITKKYKTVFIYNLIALLLVLAMIPWPFRGLGAAWF